VRSGFLEPSTTSALSLYCRNHTNYSQCVHKIKLQLSVLAFISVHSTNIHKTETMHRHKIPFARSRPTVKPNNNLLAAQFLGCYRPHFKRDGTRVETRFHLSAKRTSPFKSAGGVSSVDYWQPTCVHQR